MAPDILGNLDRLKAEQAGPATLDAAQWSAARKERVKAAADSPERWRAFLRSMAERPGMSARNLAAIAELRCTDGRVGGGHGFLELLTYEDASRPYTVTGRDGTAAERQGGVKRGEKAAVRLYSVDAEGKGRSVSYFLPSQCYDLAEARFVGAPMSARTSERNVKLIAEAMSGMSTEDIEALDPIVASTLELRYGLNASDADLADAPAYGTIDELIERLDALSKELASFTRTIDARLRDLRRGEQAPEHDRGAVETMEEDIPFEPEEEVPDNSSMLQEFSDAAQAAGNPPDEATAQDRAPKTRKQAAPKA